MRVGWLPLFASLACAGLPLPPPEAGPPPEPADERTGGAADVHGFVGAWAVEEETEDSVQETLVQVFPTGVVWIEVVGMRGAKDSETHASKRVSPDRLDVVCTNPAGCLNGAGGRTVASGQVIVSLIGSAATPEFRWSETFFHPKQPPRPWTGEPEAPCCCTAHDPETDAFSFTEMPARECLGQCLPGPSAYRCAG